MVANWIDEHGNHVISTFETADETLQTIIDKGTRGVSGDTLVEIPQAFQKLLPQADLLGTLVLTRPQDRRVVAAEALSWLQVGGALWLVEAGSARMRGLPSNTAQLRAEIRSMVVKLLALVGAPG